MRQDSRRTKLLQQVRMIPNILVGLDENIPTQGMC